MTNVASSQPNSHSGITWSSSRSWLCCSSSTSCSRACLSRCSTCSRLRSWATRLAASSQVHRQLVRLAAEDGRFDLRLERALAFGERVEVALGGVEPLLGEPQGVDVRLEVFEVGLAQLAQPLAVFEAEGFAEPLLLGGEAGFVVAGVAFQLVALPLERLRASRAARRGLRCARRCARAVR